MVNKWDKCTSLRSLRWRLNQLPVNFHYSFQGTRPMNIWRRTAPSHPRSTMQPADLTFISLCKDWQIRSWSNCMSRGHCLMNPNFFSPAHLLFKPVSLLHLLAFHCTLLHPAQLFLFKWFLQEELSFLKVNIYLFKYSF